MKFARTITEITLLTCGLFVWTFETVSAQTSTLSGQREELEEQDDKTFLQYNRELRIKYAYKDYLAVIFRNEETRQDYAKFINSHLTDQVKDDLKALRVFKKVEDVEMPVIAFAPGMDTWLGILPQWKRIKKFMFGEMEKYLNSHPEILEGPNVPTYRPRGIVKLRDQLLNGTRN